MGWWLEEANMAQVSLNLTDHDVTPIHLAYEEVCKDAAALRLPVVGSEIVGLVPLKALLQVCGPRNLLATFPSKRSRILNVRIRGRVST
jgi:glutamate formiminotransferase